jgi:two-component system, sensor histidine kinase and response regulator
METDSDNYRPKLFLVDDNNDNIQLAISLLKKQNYDIEYAFNGKDAIKMIDEFLPDLILLDIMMPEMDGFEVCKIIKDSPRTKNIPIIFLSAKTEVESIVHGFEIGGIDYITKPFKQLEILARINTHIDNRMAHQLIIEQNSKLTELNKDKDLLMQITAHDLKNPISGVAGLLDYIATNFGKLKNDDVVEIIDTAKYGLNSAMNIIGDLLDSYAFETNKLKLNMEIFDINSLIRKICSQHKRRASSKNINLICSVPDEYFYIEADKSKTARILDNLLSNSIKYSPEETNIEISSHLGDDLVNIIISDSGPGFKDEDRDKLFQKYTTLSAKPTGREISTGLGLYIVRKLTTAMNANISVENNVEGGAKFKLCFNRV